ncbi:MAG: 2-phospho-L-lactate guanylyltransferase [Thermoplasmata archaeon]|nr:2-phospho-L-lactate guanylyltransferase [Thermoplasmata archaeon]
MTTVAAIILKSFHETRPKLASVLNVGERRALTKAMFEDVANAAQGCPELSQIVVVSPEEEVLARAKERGLVAIQETDPQDMDTAFHVGVDFSLERGGDTLVSLPSDLPLLTSEDLTYLLGRVPKGPSVLVVPSTIGPGTSILVTSPPDVIEPRFEDDDHLAHLEEAMRKDVPASVVDLLQGGLDVDTPKDLARLFLVERPSKTRELLEDMELLDRFRPFF